MVAYDLTVAAHTKREMQTALLIAEQDASRERSKIIVVNTKSSPDFKLNDKLLGISDKEAHLDRNHNNTNVDTIDARIVNTRKAAYSLMGAGRIV